MRHSKTAIAAILAAMAAAAHAGPTDLGSGPGTYSFSANHDSAWYVTLGPGTYDLSSSVASNGFNLTDVWFSTSKDHKDNGGNDLGLFTMNSPTDFSGSLESFTLTKPTTVFVDVNTDLGKLTNGAFNGSFTVSAVPEPTTLAMLLAGLGLFGFMGLRRRNRG
jgi:hypothetical protein